MGNGDVSMKLQRQKLEQDKNNPSEYYLKIYYEEIDDNLFKQQEEERAAAASAANVEEALHGNDIQQSNTDGNI